MAEMQHFEVDTSNQSTFESRNESLSMLSFFLGGLGFHSIGLTCYAVGLIAFTIRVV